MPTTTEIRPATQAVAASIAALIDQLGYAIAPERLREKLAAISNSHIDYVLVATAADRLLGCIGLHAMPLFHAEGKLGCITAMVVDTAHRGQGIGHALLASSHAWFETRGCVRVEVTSGDHREEAHRFYARHGYARQEQRLVMTPHP